MDFLPFISLITLLLALSCASTFPHFTTLTISPHSTEHKSSHHESTSHHNGGLVLDIIHRNALPVSGASQSIIEETLRQDERRLKSIHERVERATKRKGYRHQNQLLSSPVASGLTLGSGEYFVRLGVGTPPRQYYLEVDTGSDVTWLQCAPCNACYSQYDPIYDPRNSSSYRPVYCGSVLCRTLDYSGCQGTGCSYQVVYGDRSSTSGDLAMEAFTMGSNVMRNIAFGCGHRNSGLFQGQAGLIGLGGGALSFMSQVGPSVGSAFSYCLVNRYSSLDATSPLVVGYTAIPFSASFTTLVRNPRITTFYYAVLTGISISGTLLPVPQSAFQISANGTGGVILDSGTSVTRLDPSAYSVFRDTYRSASRNLPSAPGVYLLDTCYDFRGMSTVQIPSVKLHFDNGVEMNLPGGNILIPVDRNGTFCLAFAPSSIPISVIGNIQQQTFRIGFDLQRSLIAIAPRQC